LATFKLMHHSFLRWFEIFPLLVFVGGWFVVAALIVLLGLTFQQLWAQSASRPKLGAVAAFFVFEIALLSYVYTRADTPNWFEPFFLFNGYAIPLQVSVVLGVHFGRSSRTRWATVGALATTALPLICILSMRGFGV
jgi:hypothetical protein